MQLSIRVTSLVLASLTLLWSTCVADDLAERAEKLEEHNEGKSFFSGAIANLDAIEAYDVLWRCEAQWVADNGAVEEKVSYGRLVVDTSNNRCCSVMNETRTELVELSKGAVDQRVVALRAVVSDGVQAWGRDVPDRASKLSEVAIESVLMRNDSPLLSATGLLRFPLSYLEARQFRVHLDYLRHGAKFELRAGDEKTQVVTYEIPFRLFKINRTFQFSRSSLTPLNMTESLVNSSKTSLTASEKYRFAERDGVFLPERISGTRSRSKKLGDVVTDGTELYLVEFRWFSVNEPLDDKLFAPQLLNDIQGMIDLTSPKLFESID
jgi:hypothetical protein